MWLGTAAAGLQLNLQGTDQATAAAASHCGNDENGVLQCDDLTDAQFNVALGSMEWFNSNRGSASVHNQPSTLSRRLSAASDVAALTVRTGALTLRAGKPPLELQWRLLLTPVAGGGAPVRADFATRYFHMQRFYPVSEALAAAGAAYRPWIILHQARTATRMYGGLSTAREGRANELRATHLPHPPSTGQPAQSVHQLPVPHARPIAAVHRRGAQGGRARQAVLHGKGDLDVHDRAVGAEGAARRGARAPPAAPDATIATPTRSGDAPP